MKTIILIIGNSGSGKTTLSNRSNIPTLHLDDIFWEKSNPPRKRPNKNIMNDIYSFIDSHNLMIVEGVYKTLLNKIPNPTHLLYLDIPMEECLSNIRKRDISKQNYIKTYYADKRFFKGNETYSKGFHDRFFKNSPLIKQRLTCLKDINNFNFYNFLQEKDNE